MEENLCKNCYLNNNCNLDKSICDGNFCVKKYKIDYLYSESLITDKQKQHIDLRIDSDNSDKEQFTQLKEIENNILEFIKDGKNLYIYSKNCGNGKTSWSLRMVESYFNKIWNGAKLECKVLFINVPKFLITLKENISEFSEYINFIKKNILKANVVIWDDIGTKAITTYESEYLLNYIDNRINLGKSNIYTSNLNNSELHQFLGDRLYSRIVNLSKCIELKGADKRGI